MSYYASISKSNFYVSNENTGRVLVELQRLPYHFELDPDGNIVGIELSRSPIGNDFPTFQNIAPYVRDKSYILFHGEGQEVWKLVFEKGVCRSVVPQIIWRE